MHYIIAYNMGEGPLIEYIKTHSKYLSNDIILILIIFFTSGIWWFSDIFRKGILQKISFSSYLLLSTIIYTVLFILFSPMLIDFKQIDKDFKKFTIKDILYISFFAMIGIVLSPLSLQIIKIHNIGKIRIYRYIIQGFVAFLAFTLLLKYM